MPVHSVLITNDAGMLLFAKYYDFRLTEEQKAEWERMVLRQTKGTWREAQDATQFFVDGPLVCLYRAMSDRDLLLFLTGSDEYDELILSDMLRVIMDLVQSACDKKASESALLHSDSYGKFCVLLDQMIAAGHVEHMKVDTIERLAKLKPLT